MKAQSRDVHVPSTDLGLFTALSLGRPSATRGPGGGCMDSGGGPLSPLLPLPPSFLFPGDFFSFLVGVILKVELSLVELFLRSSEDFVLTKIGNGMIG